MKTFIKTHVHEEISLNSWNNPHQILSLSSFSHIPSCFCSWSLICERAQRLHPCWCFPGFIGIQRWPKPSVWHQTISYFRTRSGWRRELDDIVLRVISPVRGPRCILLCAAFQNREVADPSKTISSSCVSASSLLLPEHTAGSSERKSSLIFFLAFIFDRFPEYSSSYD